MSVAFPESRFVLEFLIGYIGNSIDKLINNDSGVPILRLSRDTQVNGKTHTGIFTRKVSETDECLMICIYHPPLKYTIS